MSRKKTVKQKSIKAISKRFKITKTGKVIKKADSQNHYNAKAKGKQTRHRRKNVNLSHSDAKVIKKLIK